MTNPRALLSVSDKSGIVDFGRGLVDLGWELISTGGTARVLVAAGVPVTEVAQVTGHPEMMEGRVKTLHPAIHGGLLARRNAGVNASQGAGTDLDELAALGYGPIDLVAVNLYPFRETVASPNVTLDLAMENVDIGGPAMLRAGAKNHKSVWVVVDNSDYGRVLDALARGDDEVNRDLALELRRSLATKVFQVISQYDSAVASYLAESQRSSGDGVSTPTDFTVGLQQHQSLRYGENPDQSAAFYTPAGRPLTGVAALSQLHGKQLSYNNILDVDGALRALTPFAFSPNPGAAIIKHTTPCGLALRPTLAEAIQRARTTDPVSSFGSVIAANRIVDAAAAQEISSFFVECVVAPGFTEEAVALLEKKKNLRLLAFPEHDDNPLSSDVEVALGRWWSEMTQAEQSGARFLATSLGVSSAPDIRSVFGGVLVQSSPVVPFLGVGQVDWEVVTERRPSEGEQQDMEFAWAAVASVKSNGILIANDLATVGIGAGQMSRVDSTRIAIQKGSVADFPPDGGLVGSTLASDAFFPFRDGLDTAHRAGIKAVVQPGGSVRDSEVIEAANEHGMTMAFTGRRIFRH